MTEVAKQPVYPPPVGWPILYHLHGAVDDEPCMGRVCVVNDSGSIEVKYSDPRSYNMFRSHAIYHKDDPHQEKLPSGYFGKYGSWSWVDGMIADPPPPPPEPEQEEQSQQEPPVAPVPTGSPTPPPDNFGAMDEDEEDGEPVRRRKKTSRNRSVKTDTDEVEVKEETLV